MPPQRALALLEEMRERKVARNVIVYTAAIAACSAAGKWEQASADGGWPSPIYQRLTDASARAGAQPPGRDDAHQHQAEHDHVQYGDTGAVAAVRTPALRCTHSRSQGCRARRQACERGAQWAEAVATFERMKVLNLPPDKITYDSLVRACEAGEQWQLANEFLEMASGLDEALDGAGG